MCGSPSTGGGRSFHTAGDGSLDISAGDPYDGYGMEQYGEVVVEADTPPTLAARVGQTIERVTRLRQDPPGTDVGVALHFGDGATTIAGGLTESVENGPSRSDTCSVTPIRLAGFAWLLVVAALTACTMPPAPQPSPTPSTGMVAGVVKMCGGYYPAVPLAGATVSASQGTANRGAVVTPASGTYRLVLPSGHYVLTFTKANLKRQEPVDVTAHGASTVDMELAAGCA